MKLHNVFVLFGKVLVVLRFFQWFAGPGKAFETGQDLEIAKSLKAGKAQGNRQLAGSHPLGG